MDDLEKAIRILEGNYKNSVLRHNGELLTVNELIALLKAQQSRVMTLEEVKTADVVFMEFQDVITTRIVDTWFGNGDGDIRLAGMDGARYMAKDAYNDSWRCWTSRPDEKVRAETPWQE